jgi:hypothetical protein
LASAVSSTIIGTPALQMVLPRHLHAVGGVGVDHHAVRFQVSRMVARRSAWVLLPLTKP